MPSTLFGYAWRYSRVDQLILLAVTFATFPILYLTLEIPKQIINDAIGGANFPVILLGLEVSQLQYLSALCGLFLAAVIASGLMKMRLNTMKGIVSERLLRRLRYELITRIHRFPLARFRRTSQGELSSMVIAEAEPLGGIMGEIVAQPVFQAGQMLTIFAFLLVQNVWFALAAVALIPVQAYVIPMIQRRVNQLNRQRVQNQRVLAERIGENVSGMVDLRANGGLPVTRAEISAILGRSFDIRLRIFKLKFFMKFLNNFINQLTPFLFFAIGGTLVIRGELTLGALVAALAAFKDLAAPWKELLAFYNQYQDMSLRYEAIREQFDRADMIPAELVDGRPTELAALAGPLKLTDVTVLGEGETVILDHLSIEIPQGALVAISCPDSLARTALAQVLARQIAPYSGRVLMGDHDIAHLHQEVISRRIGLVNDQPFLFKGTVGRNITAALRIAPTGDTVQTNEQQRRAQEALRVGNAPDPVDVSWIDPSLAGVGTREELRSWWLEIVEAMGTDGYLARRALETRITPDEHPRLAQALVALRQELTGRLARHGLAGRFIPFDPTTYHPGLAVGENLLFAIPRRPLRADDMAGDPRFLATLRRLGVEEELTTAARDMLRVLVRTFGEVGTDHPMFRRLPIDAATFSRLAAIYERKELSGRADDSPEDNDIALMMTLPFKLTAESVPEAVPQKLRDRVLQIRAVRQAELRDVAGDLFVPLSPDAYVPGLTLLENAIYGRLPLGSTDGNAIGDEVIAMLTEHGLKADLAITIADVETNVGGTMLPPVARERVAFVRAVVKRPDLLVLDRFLASHGQAERAATRDRLRKLLPEATIVLLEPAIGDPEAYDMVVNVENGRIVGQTEPPSEASMGQATDDLDRKIRLLRTAPLFARLPAAQIRLLAFASDRLNRRAGDFIFRAGDTTDGAYLLVDGEAQLRWPEAEPNDEPLMVVEPGRVVGDLAVILRTPRTVDMVAVTDIEALRIRKDEFLDIVSSDAGVATSLLETVAGYLAESGTERRSHRKETRREPA